MVNTRQTKSLGIGRIIFGTIIVLVSVFCFLCEIGAFDFVGSDVKRFLIGSFGLAVFAYSLVLIIVGLAIIFRISVKMQPLKVLFISLMLLLGILALQSYTSSPCAVGNSYGDYLLCCYDANNTAGGLILGLITFPLMRILSPVGAVVAFCGLFFVLVLIFIYPLLKKNTQDVIAPSQKLKIERGSRFAKQSQIVMPLTNPAIVDFSKDCQNGDNLIAVGISSYNKQVFNKKVKGTSGYLPLDDIKENVQTENQYKGRFVHDEVGYSKKDLAKRIVFSEESSETDLNSFNTLLNPDKAFNNFGYNYKPIQKNEIVDKLDARDNGYQDFAKKYNLNESSDGVTLESNIFREPTPTPKFEMPEVKKSIDNEKIDYLDIDSIKQSGIDEFAKKYNVVEPEFESESYDNQQTEEAVEYVEEPKEVVKPATVHHFDIPTTESVDNSAVNTGILGALNAALNDKKEEPIKEEVVVESDAYTKTELVDNKMPKYPSSTTKKSIEELEKNGYKPIQNEKKIPYAFSNTSIYDKPVEQTHIFLDSLQNDGTVKRTREEVYYSPEEQLKRAKAKAASKEAPEIGEYEAKMMAQNNAQKIATSNDKKMQKMLNKMSSVDTSSQRIVQTTIEEAIEQTIERKPYVAPTIDLLNPPAPAVEQNEDYEAKSQRIVNVLSEFSVIGEVINYQVGPTFTMYKVSVQLPKGKSISFISGLEKDFQMRLPSSSVRIIAPIPGENAIGIEIPNAKRRNVNLSEIILSEQFNKSQTSFALGENIYGECGAIDIKKMPHGLIAGATGQGKSCAINALIVSLLFKCSPEDLRFILIDPKMMEFSVYNGIPHLLIDEVILDTDKAIRSLNWAITEMERRMRFLSTSGFRDIDDYNADAVKNGLPKMPRILIVVDEFADLMSTGKKNVETSVDRIARLARAAGIHLVLATQRPSVDVISGTIKNNFPTRIACKVTSSFDSKTVLDQVGADKLLGYGDLLYMTPGKNDLERMQGAFVQPEEVKRVVDFVKEHNQGYFDQSIKDAIFKDEEVEQGTSGNKSMSKNSDDQGQKIPEFYKALEVGIEIRRSTNAGMSISLLQRKLGLGFAKAGRVYDMLDNGGYLSQDENDPKKKYVNITYDDLKALKIADGVDVGEEE